LGGAAASAGGVVSRTVIVWLTFATLPHESVALHVRVRVYLLAHGCSSGLPLRS
jgi:hypothetical protein